MKKVMAIVLGAALVFAAAGQASATALETKGEFRGRYWFLNNYNLAGGDSVESDTGFWDQRLRLNMAWQVAENVKVGARADILEEVWGTSDNEIDFDQAFAAIGLGMTTLTVGKQDVTWGPGAFAKADNRTRVKIGGKFDPVSVSFAWDVNKETFDSKDVDDNNGYSLGVVIPAGGMTVGVLGFYSIDDTTPDVSKDLMGVDVTLAGAAGPAKISAEFAYATGTIDNEVGSDVDRTGMLAYVGATMPAGPATIGLELGYAAGDDLGTAGENEGALFHDYQSPFNSFILFNNFDLSGWNSVFPDDKGLNNALAVKASATFAASQQLSFMGAVVYAMADQTAPGQDDSMGFEVDALAKYAVTENVALLAGVGYLAAGDYFGKNVDSPMVGTVQAVVSF